MCNVPFAPSFWKNVNEYLEEELEAENYNVVENLIINYGDSIMLCCNEHKDYCTCDMPVAWSDIEGRELLTKEDRESAYNYQSECSGCVKYYTQLCLPYRDWLLYYYKNVEPSKEITVCDDYVPDPAISNTKVKTK